LEVDDIAGKWLFCSQKLFSQLNIVANESILNRNVDVDWTNKKIIMEIEILDQPVRIEVKETAFRENMVIQW
jgi:hypothetical protein